jgi:hypothetical protein
MDILFLAVLCIFALVGPLMIEEAVIILKSFLRAYRASKADIKAVDALFGSYDDRMSFSKRVSFRFVNFGWRFRTIHSEIRESVHNP